MNIDQSPLADITGLHRVETTSRDELMATVVEMTHTMAATTHRPPCPVEHDAGPGSPGERALQDALGTRDRAVRFHRDQVSALLTPRLQAFIGSMEMVWIATSDGAGRC